MSSIHYWRYTLRSRIRLNAASARTEFEGALLRIGEGYGCIHPWPELGDEPLDRQLKIFSEGGGTPLIAGARECAQYDGKLREKSVGLPGDRIPESHWLVRPGDDPDFAREEGFRYAKIKGSPAFRETLEEMNLWMEAGFRIRLDFNESIPEGGFLPFWEKLTEEEKAAIEFVEDPERHSDAGWSLLRSEGVPIAVDREAEKRLQPGDVLVVKPARPECARPECARPECARADWCMNQDTPCLVTSYMDHAIGQMFAAHRAAAMYGGKLSDQRLACGLLTHRCFEEDEFFERIRADGPRLLPAEGTGLGFDDLLEKLPWKRLT